MSAPTQAFARPQNVRAGIGLMVAGVTTIAVMDTMAKMLTQDYPVLQVVWARFTFHWAIFAVLFAGMGARGLVATRRPGLQIMRSLMLMTATMFFFTALKFLPLAEATSIGFVSPLLVTALAIPILGERVGLRRWLAILAGFAGVLIIIRPGMGVMHWAAAMPLGMALCFALYQILTRIAGRTEDARTSQFWAPAAGVVVLSAIAPFLWVPPSLGDWLLMVVVGLCGGIGHFLMIKGFERAPASVLSPFVYVQLLWMTLAGYAVFGDFPDGFTIAGGLIVVVSGLYIFRREGRLRPERPG